VSLGCVDMAILQVERPAYGVHALWPVGNLPAAEAEHRWRNPYDAPELGDLRATTSVADWAVNRRIIGDLAALLI
jgi:hypothetical protein